MRYCLTCPNPLDNDPYAQGNQCGACRRKQEAQAALEEKRLADARDQQRAAEEARELPLCVVQYYAFHNYSQRALCADTYTVDGKVQDRIAILPLASYARYDRDYDNEFGTSYTLRACGYTSGLFSALREFHFNLVSLGWRATYGYVDIADHTGKTQFVKALRVPEELYNGPYKNTSIGNQVVENYWVFIYRYAPSLPYDYFYQLLHIDERLIRPVLPASFPPKKKRKFGLW